MTLLQANSSGPGKPLRLWPGIVVVGLQWFSWLVLPALVPEAAMAGVLGALVAGLVVVAWWAFFSRAHWAERVGALLLIVAGLVVTPRFLHPSIATGMMGMMFYLYAIPVLSLALVAGALAGGRRPEWPRRVVMAAAILLGCGALALVRTEGVTGGGSAELAWRWSETPEERLLADAAREPATAPPVEAPSAAPSAVPSPSDIPLASAVAASVAPPAVAPAGAETPAEWPGFRGPGRDGVVRGARIEADWAAFPPVELWRRPIGPGWSSFAVRGDVFYTQEQRGGDEVVACYRVSTGEPVWAHRDAARFWESNAGAGPRATPTLDGDRAYTLGATGIVNALDAQHGGVLWSRNAADDTATQVPHWGFAGSPLVVVDLVVVAAAGALAAYDRSTGDLRWLSPSGGGGYSSPHIATIDGIRQVLLLRGSGVVGVSPADGAVLWEHAWSGDGIVQPALTPDGDVLIGSGSGIGAGAAVGVRRLAVARRAGAWTVAERWTSAGLKPYYNDFVLHGGHAFGFDGGILACVDLSTGERRWKGGRYGHGQVVLLPEQDLLLVLSEKGELVLVGATPDGFAERGHLPAIEGKTWNHPALAGDVLLVRNDEEMAAFRLARR